VQQLNEWEQHQTSGKCYMMNDIQLKDKTIVNVHNILMEESHFRLYNHSFRDLLNHLVTWTCSFSNPPSSYFEQKCITKHKMQYLMYFLHTIDHFEIKYLSPLS